MSTDEKQAAAEKALAEVKAENEAAEMEASDARTSAKGWPISTPDGEVMVVEKITSQSGMDTVVTEDGVEYERDANQRLTWHKVGSTFEPTAPAEAPAEAPEASE